MGLPNVNITLGNGNLDRVASSSDGVAGLILTGTAVSGKLTLNTPVVLTSRRDLATYGIAEDTNPLAYDQVTGFYDAAGDGSELHLIVVSEATTLVAMCAAEDASPLHKLVDSASGRIRLVGINKLTPAEYSAQKTARIDPDAVAAATAAQQVAEEYLTKMRPMRLLIPACGWDGTTQGMFQPRENATNRCHFILSSDGKVKDEYVADIGTALGRAAKIKVCQSLGRVKDGPATDVGYFTNGKTVDEMIGQWDILYDYGYIFLRTFPGRNGCYFCGDSAATPVSDDYSELYLGRTIDKAFMIVHDTYVSEIKDNVEVDEQGKLPRPICTYYEGLIERAVLTKMEGEISGFTSRVDPDQNILSTSRMKIVGKIRPLGVLSDIDFELSYDNPANS